MYMFKKCMTNDIEKTKFKNVQSNINSIFCFSYTIAVCINVINFKRAFESNSQIKKIYFLTKVKWFSII